MKLPNYISKNAIGHSRALNQQVNLPKYLKNAIAHSLNQQVNLPNNLQNAIANSLNQQIKLPN